MSQLSGLTLHSLTLMKDMWEEKTMDGSKRLFQERTSRFLPCTTTLFLSLWQAGKIMSLWMQAMFWNF